MIAATSLFVSALFSAHLHAQRVQELLPDAFALPSAKVVIDGAPGGKLMGQQPPGAPAAQHVEDGIDDFASGVYVIGGLCTERWYQGLQELPLLVGEIGWIGLAIERHRHALVASFHLFCSFS